jgi:hypothetical protein
LRACRISPSESTCFESFAAQGIAGQELGSSSLKTEWQPGSRTTTGTPDSTCGASAATIFSSDAFAWSSMPKS